MYVFGNGVVTSVAKDPQKTVVEVQIPSYLKEKNESTGRIESKPGRIRLTNWVKGGPNIDGILGYIKENETQVMYVAEETQSKGKDGKWYTNYTLVSLTFAGVSKNQRPQAAAKTAAKTITGSEEGFQEVAEEEDFEI
jgi:hypothetical protein